MQTFKFLFSFTLPFILSFITLASSARLPSHHLSKRSLGASCSTGSPNGIKVSPGTLAITKALASIPSNGETYTLLLAAGVYTEQVKVTRANVIFRSCATGKETTIIRYDARGSSDPATSTMTVSANNFSAYYITFENSRPETPSGQALAVNVEGAIHVAFYHCSFFGFQDTLLVDKYSQALFKDSWIEGSVDFIFGYGTAYFDSCYIVSNAPGCITAHNRLTSTAAGEFVFNNCHVLPTVAMFPTLANKTISYQSKQQAYSEKRNYLGRPWSQYARVVFMNSYLDNHLNSAGWSIWGTSEPNTGPAGAYTVFFAEYNNTGPGSTGTRPAFAKKLSASQANSFQMSSVFGGDVSWIDKSV